MKKIQDSHQQKVEIQACFTLKLKCTRPIGDKIYDAILQANDPVDWPPNQPKQYPNHSAYRIQDINIYSMQRKITYSFLTYP